MGDQKILFLASAYKQLVVGSGEELERAEDFGVVARCPVNFHFYPESFDWSTTECCVQFTIPIRPSLIFGETPYFLIPDEGVIGQVITRYGSIIGEASIGCPDLNLFRQKQ